MNRSPASMLGGLGLAIVLAVVGLVALRGFHIVDASETCAVTRWGELQPPISNGLFWRVPLVYRFHCYSVREVVYETSRDPSRSLQDFRGAVVDTQTKDGQTISVAYSVIFAVPVESASIVYGEVGGDMTEVARRVVETISRSEVRNGLRSYRAETLFSGDVYGAQKDIDDRLSEKFTRRGVELKDFLIREIDFAPDYIAAIEQQQIAEEQVKTAGFQAQQAEQLATKAVNEAKGQADSVIERARGEAESIKLRAEAQADANRILAESLTAPLIQYEQLQVWDGKLPLFTGGGTPLIQVPALPGSVGASGGE
jgi:regulator of protease activity HflC (stomatin/prohibitin superfamily)